jgi:hypothetical protein
VFGLSTGAGHLSFTTFGESGGISLEDGAEFSIVKQGWLQRRWTLERGGMVCAEAQKPSAFFRTFAVQTDAVTFTVQAASAFSRIFHIAMEGVVVGVIRPAHVFTRRAFVECDPALPEVAQLFAFWLAAISWRRSRRNNH